MLCFQLQDANIWTQLFRTTHTNHNNSKKENNNNNDNNKQTSKAKQNKQTKNPPKPIGKYFDGIFKTCEVISVRTYFSVSERSAASCWTEMTFQTPENSFSLSEQQEKFEKPSVKSNTSRPMSSVAWRAQSVNQFSTTFRRFLSSVHQVSQAHSSFPQHPLIPSLPATATGNVCDLFY